MKLYDFMKMSEADYDTYDTVYDACVTVCYADEEDDSDDKFCNEIMKKVEVAEVHENCLIVDWSALIVEILISLESLQKNIGSTHTKTMKTNLFINGLTKFKHIWLDM